MESTRQVTAIIEREGDMYVALCPELDIASQGQTVETARTSLIGPARRRGAAGSLLHDDVTAPLSND